MSLDKDTKYAVMFAEGDLGQVKADGTERTKEEMKALAKDMKILVKALGDDTWTDYDYGHSARGTSTNGEQIIGMFYDFKEEETNAKFDALGEKEDEKRDSYKVDSKTPEYRDVVKANKEIVGTIIEDKKLERINFSEVIVELRANQKETKSQTKTSPKTPTQSM